MNYLALTGKPLMAAALFSAFALSSCEKSVEAPEPTTNAVSSDASQYGQPGVNYIANEVLVKFKAGTSATARDAALSRVNGQVAETILTKAMQRAGEKEAVLVVRTPLAAAEAIGRLKGEEVEYVEPNYIYTHQAVSTDPKYTDGSLWGMYSATSSPANQFGSGAANAWAAGHTGSASVVMGVIDEGIQFTHPDLDGQVWTNPFDKADGIDNDGNGYVDDIHGWDFDGNNNTVYDGGSSGGTDDHGTHVAGTIGAKANNGQGVVGMNWSTTIISCKFLGRRGGSLSNAIKAVDYLNDLKARHGMNIVASNNSWGGGAFSQALKDAIDRANTANILFIAAAGNGGSDGVGDDNDATPSYPSSYTSANVIAVAAITKLGDKSSFSNFGATSVDIGAPGSAIWSSTAFSIYESYNGTSMATPHVTGAAGLYAAQNPGASAATIKAAILNSATPTASMTGKCVTNGRLNVSGF
ncbi:peptidase S8 [Hymenobacter lapidarius]|uniref:Peptidase S8 n=1 Tax=Hymenobacter lapidarius TaxID=1908237 RepID=A0A1G1T4L8_9BACT|nr:S8 family peptidase [Hymenobacter lapidarius]OGX85803.1 peptidase S8 [Hymenobacter lapidarius]